MKSPAIEREIAARSFEVDAPQARIWRLIGKVIFSCLPGMEEVEVADEMNFRAIQRMKVAFIELRMKLKGEITDITPPESLAVSLTIEGPGGLIRMRQKVTIGITAIGGKKTAVSCKAVANDAGGPFSRLLLARAKLFVQALFKDMEKRLQYLVAEQ
ncbi:MAG: Carbon monoxide dehydrogenase subunit G (CoxG) [Syntrophorhabdus sp. PtaU1.Bin058]|nr:MAG: Carbon monoxide dehydrogenase subunit G (CoxG) [Syntrophorhabdus sp. PtaU1.Bin058]